MTMKSEAKNPCNQATVKLKFRKMTMLPQIISLPSPTTCGSWTSRTKEADPPSRFGPRYLGKLPGST
jgi:hypothetical protein